jgi:hypothetical protein
MPITISGSTGIAGVDGSASTPAVQGTDTNTGIVFPAADTVTVATGGAERMRVDSSGNVGIGTSSAGAKLDVVSSGLPFRIAASTSSGYALSQFGQAATASQNWHIGSEGDGTFRFYNGNFGAGTEQARIDSSGNFQFNSGYGSVATAYGCRAWVNFNGTGTVAIRASGNVTSITDNNVGDYTVNFANAMPDANYAMIGQGGTGNGRVVYEYNGTYNTANSTTVRTSSSCRILYADTTTGAASDNAGIYVSFFR